DIVVEVRAILHANAQVHADKVADVLLIGQLLQRIDAIKPHDIDVVNEPTFGSKLCVHAEVAEKQTRIHEVGLTLSFAGSQVGNQAHPLHEVYTEEFDLLTLPIRKLAASEVRIV